MRSKKHWLKMQVNNIMNMVSKALLDDEISEVEYENILSQTVKRNVTYKKFDDLELDKLFPEKNWVSFVKHFQSRVHHFSCRALQSYNSPSDWARELFKPSTDSASLLVDIEKKICVLGLSFSGGNVTSRCVFVLFWPSLPGPGRCPDRPFFGLKI